MARPKFPSDKQDQFMLRLPYGMRDRIKSSADANNRSMNAEIVSTLEEKYPAPSFNDNITHYVRMYDDYMAGEISHNEWIGSVPRYFRFFMEEFSAYSAHDPEAFSYDEAYESAWFEGRRSARRVNGSLADNPYGNETPQGDAWLKGFESVAVASTIENDEE